MAKDPYRYFRIEARELADGLAKATLELEKKGDDRSLIDRLLRQAHTLKGAARVVKENEIADQAHAIEDLLAPHREGKPVAGPTVAGLLAAIDTIAARVAVIGAPAPIEPAPMPSSSPPVPAPPQARRVDESFETVRVAVTEMDELLHGVSESLVQVTALRREVAAVEEPRRLVRELSERAEILGERDLSRLAGELGSVLERHQHNLQRGLDSVDAEVTQVRDSANQLRLLPASMLFPVLERAVRDAADTLGKQVAFTAGGGEHRLDAHVLGKLRAALGHIVRNAVAHGIEPGPRRLAAGKPPVGQVSLAVERRHNRVAFICSDDGAGIDVEAVRAAAVRAGRLGAAEAALLGIGDVTRLILGAGISTRSAPDAISGRGVGLDVVADTALHLKAEVSIHSEPGRGVRFELVVPVSLSVVRALEVEGGGVVAHIPLDAVRESVRLSADDLARGATGDAVVHRGRSIPFSHLAQVLGGPAPVPRRFWTTIILEAPGGRAAVAVDRLLGISDVVVRPLPVLLEAEHVVSGASLDAQGNPELFLDAEGLVAAARRARPAASAPSEPVRHPVLVIDDSLTTRMLEQNILESAGYHVELATSAEEGLLKARAGPYSLFLVDVEMPGMDGFEFVERTRADAELGRVPAILVTSRGSVDDRRRGERAGARGYIVKGEFDQGHLLSMIRGLIG